MAQYVYTMNRVGKIVPPKRADPQEHLALLLPGRQDRRAGAERLGQVEPAQDHGGRRPGVRGRGHADARTSASASCRRSRSSTRTRPCARRSRRAWARCSARRSASTRSTPRTPSPTPTSTQLAAEQAKLEAILASSGADAEPQLEIAADALRLPPWDAKSSTLSGGEKRRVALCRLLLSQARHAAARRAHQPPRRRERRVARAVPRQVPRHRDRRDPRPLLPRQRRRVDPRARPRLRHPVEGQLHSLARAEGAAPRHRAEAGGGAHRRR